MLSRVWTPQRGSENYIQKRRGRKAIEVTRRRGGGVKRRETNLASNQFPKCYPQPRTPKKIQRGREEKGEGGDRGDVVEKKESQKRERAIKPVISVPSKNGY